MADEFLRPGEKFQVCSAEAIANGGAAYTSDPIDLTMLKENIAALQYELEDAGGAGSASIVALITLNGTDYVDTLTAVEGGVAKADGSKLEKIDFDSMPALAMKIKVTETGAENITISIWAAGK